MLLRLACYSGSVGQPSCGPDRGQRECLG
jgi:hypothetical protein